jgi:hypothetical protein
MDIAASQIQTKGLYLSAVRAELLDSIDANTELTKGSDDARHLVAQTRNQCESFKRGMETLRYVSS